MAHVATITIDYTKVPGDLTDYVGLIVPDGSAGYSALYALCLEGGGDIRLFKSDDTTELAREIVTFSVSAETGEIHYKYSGTLSSSVDTAIHVYADGSSADYAVGATYGRNNVWSAYAGVWHLGEASGTRTDSTGNNNLIDNNTVTSGAGQIGDAAELNGSNEYLSITDTAQSGLEPSTEFTITAYIKTNTVSGSHNIAGKYRNDTNQRQYIFDVFNDGFRSVVSTAGINSGATVRDCRVTGVFNAGSWYHVALNVDVTTEDFKHYVDGSYVANATESGNLGASVFNGTADFQIGSYNIGGSQTSHFDGLLDEVRFTSSTLSANWITTEYNNQNSYSTFYSVAAVAGGSAAQAARRGVIMMM